MEEQEGLRRTVAGFVFVEIQTGTIDRLPRKRPKQIDIENIYIEKNYADRCFLIVYMRSYASLIKLAEGEKSIV